MSWFNELDFLFHTKDDSTSFNKDWYAWDKIYNHTSVLPCDETLNFTSCLIIMYVDISIYSFWNTTRFRRYAFLCMTY